MKIVDRAENRGKAEHGWLHSNFSFSFADYYNPDKTNFGLLRVLNDDIIEPSEGFGMHPHNNMEIFTVMLDGELAHKDSMGTGSVIKKDEIQIMSAGSGVLHSEVNNSESEQAKLLQIWIFPKERDIQPRYDEGKFPVDKRRNQVKKVISGKKDDGMLYINQDAAVSLGNLDKSKSAKYEFNYHGNGAYIFVIEGELNVEGEILKRRDAIGVSEIDELSIVAIDDSDFIIIEVPMK